MSSNTSIISWHPRNEVPSSSGFYLVALSESMTAPAYFDQNGWEVYDGWFRWAIIAWAPLPKMIQQDN